MEQFSSARGKHKSFSIVFREASISLNREDFFSNIITLRNKVRSLEGNKQLVKTIIHLPHNFPFPQGEKKKKVFQKTWLESSKTLLRQNKAKGKKSKSVA